MPCLAAGLMMFDDASSMFWSLIPSERLHEAPETGLVSNQPSLSIHCSSCCLRTCGIGTASARLIHQAAWSWHSFAMSMARALPRKRRQPIKNSSRCARIWAGVCALKADVVAVIHWRMQTSMDINGWVSRQKKYDSLCLLPFHALSAQVHAQKVRSGWPNAGVRGPKQQDRRIGFPVDVPRRGHAVLNFNGPTCAWRSDRENDQPFINH